MLGFHVGPTNADADPDWTQSLYTMDVSGDPSLIPPGGTIGWKSQNVVERDVDALGPHPTDVTATLNIPQPQWDAMCPSS
jgi:hypothetical protein